LLSRSMALGNVQYCTRCNHGMDFTCPATAVVLLDLNNNILEPHNGSKEPGTAVTSTPLAPPEVWMYSGGDGGGDPKRRVRKPASAAVALALFAIGKNFLPSRPRASQQISAADLPEPGGKIRSCVVVKREFLNETCLRWRMQRATRSPP
jgi:hypothetical protein